MTNRIHVPTRGPSDWQQLLAAPEKHWRAGYSAMSAALSWENSNGLPAEIERIFEAVGMDPAELLLAIPEWKTPLPGGQRDSQTDVLAFVRTPAGLFVTGVEAKVGESFGPTVGEWLDDASPGKIERLTAICQMLGLAYPPPASLRYQLFHRTAAAVIEARRFGAAGAAMIVQSFSSERPWLDDWRAFGDLFDVRLSPESPALLRLSDGLPLLLGWACCPPNC